MIQQQIKYKITLQPLWRIRAQFADDNLKRGQTSRLRASLLPNI
jgi:hypothetical protein